MFERHGVNFVFFACVGNSKERDEKKSIKEYLERIFSISYAFGKFRKILLVLS